MTEGNTDTINDRNSLTPDDERQYDITFRTITNLDDVSREMQRYLALDIVRQMTDTLRSEQPLFCALTVKELADKMLEIACEGAYATICEGHTDDRLLLEVDDGLDHDYRSPIWRCDFVENALSTLRSM